MPRVAGSVKIFHDQPRTADGRGSGYGFIIPDDGGPEIFFHRMELGATCTQVRDNVSVRTLKSGDRVTFEVVTGTPGKGNGLKAAKVERIDS